MLINDLFLGWEEVLGRDFKAYQNHVLRLLAFYQLLEGEAPSEKIQIAAFFHDLGIWSDQTLDYIVPSIALAEAYLIRVGKVELVDEVSMLIAEHHKISPFAGAGEVEVFRKADLVDLSLGMVKFGLSTQNIREIKKEHPNLGFHKKLISLTWGRFKKFPLDPLPMFHW